MKTIEFQKQYDALATEFSKLNFTRKDMSPKEAEVKNLELRQEETKLFSEFVGTKIDILA